MYKIDAHIHWYADHPDCTDMFDRVGLKLLNVCVALDADGSWREDARVYGELASRDPKRFAWCTTFDPFGFGDPDFAERVIAGLVRDFADGAAGCKVWKNIGMEIRKPTGEFLMIDDPVFDPIFGYLQKEGITVLAHIGEPRECWEPLNPDGPHHGYYRAHPEWHMYGRTDFPSYRSIIDARDRMLAKFPKLPVVGAHLGSLEYDVEEIARRLDRYPNFAVDSSARILNLVHQRSAVVRRFFESYQDRILFGTDIVHMQRASTQSPLERRTVLASREDHYRMEGAYFESTDTVHVNGREIEGLGLPEAVLKKFYSTNTVRWYGCFA